jgi:phosphatidylglycerol:prolipoprotein diacylglycerol transferase
MDVTISHPELFFTSFYLLAFAFIFTIVIYKSIKRGYHLRSVLLMLTTISLLTIIGSRLLTIPFNDWIPALTGEYSFYNNRSAIGGLLFGLIGLFVSQRVFGFNRPMLDLYAWIVPIAMGIQKLGCFLIGCCYGNTTNLFWGVQYPKGSNAHFNHWASGLVEEEAMSLAVHPVQLYEALLLITIGYIVWKTHKRWKHNASAILFALFVFFMFRFGIEFIRDPAGSQFNANYLLGVRVFQWAILGLGLICGVLFMLYEKIIKIELIKGRQNSPYIHSDLLYILSISVVIYTCKGLFTNYELIALWMKFAPAIVFTFYYLVTDPRQKMYRVVTSILLFVPMYVISQTIEVKDTIQIEKYKRIDIGGGFGDFLNKVTAQVPGTGQTSGDCGSAANIYETQYFKSKYSIFGIGASQINNKHKITTVNELSKKKSTTYRFGLNVSGGTIETTNINTNESESNSVYAVSPYYQYDSDWLGWGVGFSVGDFRINKNERVDYKDLDENTKSRVFRPEFYARLGNRKYLDLTYHSGYMFPSLYPLASWRISLGSSFGLSPDYNFRFGWMGNKSNYISAEALITNRIGLNFMYINRSFEEYDSSLNKNITGAGKLYFGVHYRFDYKTK